MAGYLPLRDAELGQWAANFSAVISASPGAVGLVPGDADTIATYVNAFTEALAVSTSKKTRTPATVAAKDGAKAAMLSIVRPYALRVRMNDGVSGEQKATLGLTLVDGTRSRIGVPASNPILSILAATPGEHELRYSDVNAPDRRAKPVGTVGLQLFVAVEDQAVRDPSEAQFRSLVTTQPYAVKFQAEQDGKRATYFGRWQNRKGEVGPWSNAVTFTIVG